ncbi:dihydrofolate reductase [Ligilactobacillus ceti]|uniref:Dihydrofolate reductase n=1 Tax=Ligilactobacillus ceti DSM 22408 TaxID=1122146 RepID=A0A0R2KHB2_9LACO|nr:dihydrofolate reductase [Ligilactobacillus ceti]KRN88770.1 dihydrofolate reductase [Ligilactobacillus ceti DSM 22408]
MLAYMWAEDQLGQIGYQGKLPWHLPADLAHFKETTMNHPMIMGRKTFASFPKLLPGRKHLVLTRQAELVEKYADNDQVMIFTDLPSLRKWLKENDELDPIIIGGASLFEIFKKEVQTLYQTQIQATFKGDTVMPQLAYEDFTLVQEDAFSRDEKNAYDYVFKEYRRKK